MCEEEQIELIVKEKDRRAYLCLSMCGGTYLIIAHKARLPFDCFSSRLGRIMIRRLAKTKVRKSSQKPCSSFLVASHAGLPLTPAWKRTDVGEAGPSPERCVVRPVNRTPWTTMVVYDIRTTLDKVRVYVHDDQYS